MPRTQQDADLRRWILGEPGRLFKTLKPWLVIPPETEQGYALALDHVVSEFEMTALVNEAIRTRWPSLGWPSPAELRDLLAEMRERLGTAPPRESADDCDKCRGSGYQIVEQDGARKARPCACRRAARRSFGDLPGGGRFSASRNLLHIAAGLLPGLFYVARSARLAAESFLGEYKANNSDG